MSVLTILVVGILRLGTKVIEVKNVSKAFGDRQLVQDLSFSVPPGSIVGEHTGPISGS